MEPTEDEINEKYAKLCERCRKKHFTTRRR